MFEQNTFLAQEVESEPVVFQADEADIVTMRRSAGNPGYQLPARVWGMMIACYAGFFAAIFAATGGSGHARFAIVISVLYTAVYFGLARIGARLPGREERSPIDRGLPLQTWTGPMDRISVYSQVLIVPAVLAFFGIGIALIIGFVR